ncbi:MAG: LEA type 2 family protein [Bacteroidetes bacterium]|nr:LEA type 2 family protein [Bacteroidota bacterium]
MKIKFLLFSTLTLLLISCSVQEIMKTAGISEPIVKFQSMKIDNLSFEDVNLLFNFSIDNPNAIGIDLAGFNYDVEISNNSFVAGNQDKGLSIASRGQSTMQIPVKLNFTELVGMYKVLKSKDSVDYKLSGDFIFDLPVLGNVRVPYATAGNLPIIKVPSISIGELKLNNLNLLGAEVLLRVKCDNPNAFSVGINGFDYILKIAGKEWVQSNSNQKIKLNSHGQSEIEIPIKLNFLQVGQSVYQLLTGNAKLDYNLVGNFNLETSLPYLKNEVVNIVKNGEINLSR